MGKVEEEAVTKLPEAPTYRSSTIVGIALAGLNPAPVLSLEN
jgi:hypothetical protein